MFMLSGLFLAGSARVLVCVTVRWKADVVKTGL